MNPIEQASRWRRRWGNEYALDTDQSELRPWLSMKANV